MNWITGCFSRTPEVLTFWFYQIVQWRCFCRTTQNKLIWSIDASENNENSLKQSDKCCMATPIFLLFSPFYFHLYSPVFFFFAFPFFLSVCLCVCVCLFKSIHALFLARLQCRSQWGHRCVSGGQRCGEPRPGPLEWDADIPPQTYCPLAPRSRGKALSIHMRTQGWDANGDECSKELQQISLFIYFCTGLLLFGRCEIRQWNQYEVQIVGVSSKKICNGPSSGIHLTILASIYMTKEVSHKSLWFV